jgi:hypothetical protein
MVEHGSFHSDTEPTYMENSTIFEVLDGATLPCPVIPYHLRFLDPTAATVALIKIGSQIWGMCLGPMCSRA